ncbi:Uncharacterised protein [Mycobacteroides abscessus subsp. abscessus]|nr:Uncharacterised protein [Mycobacteroides abscessus subsp. abscessus]
MSPSALMTRAGTVTSARWGSARVCACDRLHMPSQFFKVVAPPIPNVDRLAFTGTPA